jgi:hypothetical protein
MHRGNRTVLVWNALAITACSTGTSDGTGQAMQEPSAPSAYGAAVERDIARVRQATEAFRSLDAAASAGYARTVAQCVAHPEHGAMGHHHTNDALLDDRLEVQRPEILVYERMTDGEYVLNGVEYIIPYSSRSRDTAPPEIMGQKLKRADGLRLWYLHVWIWKENSAGMFADWHPAVECRP